MIDASKVTDFKRNKSQLEEFLLFSIAVSGKTANVTARNLERFLQWGRKEYRVKNPFDVVKNIELDQLGPIMKSYGFGCWKMKSKGFHEAANSGFDLNTCSVEQLETIHGIAQKTSRFFVMHSRENQQLACLDVHILNWMRNFTGYEIPKITPKGKKYIEIENQFLSIAEAMNISPADLDLKIWMAQRGGYEILAA